MSRIHFQRKPKDSRVYLPIWPLPANRWTRIFGTQLPFTYPIKPKSWLGHTRYKQNLLTFIRRADENSLTSVGILVRDDDI